MSRLIQLLDQLRSHERHSCMIAEGNAYTYAQLLEQFEHWRLRLEELGVAPSDVVGIRADFSLSAVAALLGLCARHAVVALIPRGRDPARYLEDAHASAMLDFDVLGNYEWRRLPHPVRRHSLLERLHTAGDGGIVLFTSGSTGIPKAALQSTERFLSKFQRPGRRFRTLAFLLFDHVAGLDTLFYTLASGGTLVIARKRDPDAILALITWHKVEVLPASPSFLRMLCAGPERGGYDLSSLKVITYGSEIMDPTTLQRLNVRFPTAQISQKYGTTETGAPRSASRGNGSLWLKIKNDSVETKIVDGILWMRSEGTMLGYLNAPSPIDDEGWYCTGDLVEVDGEWLRFVGRAADIINVGGEKVSPAEVERIILELDFVRDVVVSGEAHPLLGHVVAARVVVKTSSVDRVEVAKLIRSHCRQRLGAHRVPVKVEVTTEVITDDRQKAQRKSGKLNRMP